MPDGSPPDYALVPVDHQPDFSNASLVPVDHDPFAEGGVVQEAQAQPAQMDKGLVPQERSSQPSSDVAGQSDASAPAHPPIDRMAPSAPGDGFPTADAAAIAALRNALPATQHDGLEYAGRVYRRWLGFGDYSYTPPAPGDAFRSDPGNSVIVPLLHSLGVNAGTYHTHTRGLYADTAETYSPGDTDRSNEEEAPAYLGTPSGKIYRYLRLPNRSSQDSISVLESTNGSSDHSRTQPGK